MKLGFVSAILPELSATEVLTIASEIGYDCVELMCWPTGLAERRYAGITHVEVNPLKDVAQLQQTCEKLNVSISGLGYYPNLLAENQQEATTAAEHLQHVMRAAVQLKIPVVNTFVGRNPALSVKDNWERFLQTWKPILKLAEEINIKIGIENCPMLFTADEWPGGKNLATSPSIWRNMFKDFPTQSWGLNYDPSHFVWQQMDYLLPLNEFRNRLVHIHAKDVYIDRQKLNDVGILATPLAYHTPKLPGLGMINWGEFISVLGSVGYQGAVCVEVEDRVYEGSLSSRIQALEQAYYFLRNYIPKRKQLT